MNNKLRVDLDRMGYKWLDGCSVKVKPDGKKEVTLPLPSAFLTEAKPESGSSEEENEHDWGLKDEEMSLHQVLLTPSATSTDEAQVLPSMKIIPASASE